MAQYRPSNLIPSTLTSTYTIDASVANEFRCQINGSSPTIKYQLKIMQNNATSTVVYDSGLVSLTTPLYPTDYTGAVNELVVAVPANQMTNGNEYKWSIASYWTNTDYYESYENVFKAYKKPTLTLDTIPSPITTKDYTFSATFTQAQGVQVERFGWQLSEKGSDIYLVDTITTGNIYSNDIKLYYDGLFSGTNYEIRVVCWDYNGVFLDSGVIDFTVSYETSSIEGLVSATVTDDSGVLVEWSNINIITGTLTPSTPPVEYVNDDFVNSNTIKLDGKTLTYTNINGETIDFDNNYAYAISFKKPEKKTLTLIPILNLCAELPDGREFTQTVNYSYADSNNEEIEVAYKLEDGSASANYFEHLNNFDWFILILTKTNIYLVSYGLYDATMPSLKTIISDSLYPSSGIYTSRVQMQPRHLVLSSHHINRIEIKSPNLINYFWVTKNNGVEEILSHDSDIFQYEPDFDSNTALLARFNNSISAGNYDSEVLPIGWTVYRQGENERSLHNVTEINDITKTYVVDYSITNQGNYIYFVFPVYSDTIGVPNESNNVKTNWWDWYLLNCDYDVDNDIYYVDDVFKFDLDVSSGQLSNNTAFNTLANFTKYAKIQHSNASYWSGSLTALLGNCGINYVDTVEEMNAIKNLTVDNKHKFLKDRKGNIWKVALNNPINEKIGDEFVEQRVSVTLNWAEVADCTFDRIVQSQNWVLENEEINIPIVVPLSR